MLQLSSLKQHLSWLGVTAVIAACAASALVQVNAPAFAQAPAQNTVCRNAAVQQVSASARGQAQGWASTALNTLCNGVETSTGPGQCFAHVMTSNSVNYGGGTAWNPNNALRLCAGASDAQRRVACFEGKIAQSVGWSAAIDQCVAEERTINAQLRAPVTAPAPTGTIVTAPSASSGPRSASIEEVMEIRRQAANRSAAMTCTGPLRVQIQQRDPNDARSPTHISVFFRPAASATQVGPGQCWRAGGWGDGALIHMDGEGVIYHETRLGPCALLRSMRLENGAVADAVFVDSYPAGAMFEMGRRAGSHTIETRYGGSLTEAGADPRLFNAQRPDYAGQPSHCQ